MFNIYITAYFNNWKLFVFVLVLVKNNTDIHKIDTKNQMNTYCTQFLLKWTKIYYSLTRVWADFWDWMNASVSQHKPHD